jgi:hypothetical protein
VTLSITTCSITTLSVTPFSITTLSVTPFSITTLRIMARNTAMLSVANKPIMLRVVMLNVMLSVEEPKLIL